MERESRLRKTGQRGIEEKWKVTEGYGCGGREEGEEKEEEEGR